MKSFMTFTQGGKHKYGSNLLQYFNPRISRVKITTVIYRGKKFYIIGTWSELEDPNPSPSDRDETRDDLVVRVSLEISGFGTRSRLPYESIRRCVSGAAFGGKFDSAQFRFRFRFPPPHDVELEPTFQNFFCSSLTFRTK
jgi:hypothetical protein